MLTKLSLIKPTTDVAYTIFLGQFEIVNSQASDSVIKVCPGEEYATLVQRTGNGKKGASCTRSLAIALESLVVQKMYRLHSQKFSLAQIFMSSGCEPRDF